MTSVSICLWYDGDAEAAANYYVSLLPDSRIDRLTRAPADNPSKPEGEMLIVEFTLGGRPFMGLNGGPQVKFNNAASIVVNVDTQAEVDRLWDALIADGGAASECGWLKDRWGLSWQITPNALINAIASPDRDGARRAMQAMMTMSKIDVAAIERAYAGT